MENGNGLLVFNIWEISYDGMQAICMFQRSERSTNCFAALTYSCMPFYIKHFEFVVEAASV